MLCPICKKPFEESSPQRSASFPFCSERCQLIDLGRWLEGRYQIPVADDEDEDGDRPRPSADD